MEQLSKSWIELKPIETVEGCKEKFEDYSQRIQQNRRLKHIPQEVLQHWIHDQYDFDLTIKNYAWLNFYKMEFEKIKWSIENFTGINLVEFYRNYIREKSELKRIEDFCFSEYWVTNGTWQVPPVILDVETLKNRIPLWSKIKGPFQYVDGHTRLGYLYALINISRIEKTNLAKKHWIYLMQQK